MARTINASTLTALQASSCKIIHLVSVEINPTTPTVLKYTDNAIDTTVGGITYLANDFFVDISQAAQSGNLSNTQLQIALSTTSDVLMQYMQSATWHNGDVYYYFCAVDDAYAVIGDPILLFKGLLSSFSATEGNEAVMELTADSHWADFEKKSGRRTNQNSQLEYFTNSQDKGFEFAAETVKDLNWGRK